VSQEERSNLEMLCVGDKAGLSSCV
jgi:hypothetical protein